MADIQSLTAEIRRGKKEKKEQTTGGKYIWSALLHTATIKNNKAITTPRTGDSISTSIWQEKQLFNFQVTTALTVMQPTVSDKEMNPTRKNQLLLASSFLHPPPHSWEKGWKVKLSLCQISDAGIPKMQCGIKSCREHFLPEAIKHIWPTVLDTVTHPVSQPLQQICHT